MVYSSTWYQFLSVLSRNREYNNGLPQRVQAGNGGEHTPFDAADDGFDNVSSAFLREEADEIYFIVYEEVCEDRGRRLALATNALRSPPMHPEARLEGESLDFRRKARVSRRAGVIVGRLLTIRLRSEEDECRLYTINAWHCQAHIS